MRGQSCTSRARSALLACGTVLLVVAGLVVGLSAGSAWATQSFGTPGACNPHCDGWSPDPYFGLQFTSVVTGSYEWAYSTSAGVDPAATWYPLTITSTTGTTGQYAWCNTTNGPCWGPTGGLPNGTVGLTVRTVPGHVIVVYNSVPGSGQIIPPDVTAGNCVLTDSQLVQLLRAGGFAETDIRVALSVLLAESGGKVNALNHNANGSYDLGLMQINDTAHPEFTPRDRLGTDPLFNVSAGHSVWAAAGNSFSPWVTYTTGRYLRYMDRSAAAIATAPAGALGFTDCSGAPPIEDPGGNPDRPGLLSCASWNLFEVLGCVLKWAFLPGTGTSTGWTGLVGTTSARPPFSVAIQCKDYTLGVITAVSTGADSSHVYDSGSFANGVPNFTAPTNDWYDPLGRAATFADSSTFYQVGLTLSKVFLWSLFGWWAFVRVSRSLGGKGDEA